MKWDLSNIYRSFEDMTFQSDLSKLEVELAELVRWTEENFSSYENFENKVAYCLEKLNELSLLSGKLQSYASLTLSADTNNATAAKYLDIVREKMVSLFLVRVKLRRYLSAIDFDWDRAMIQNVREHAFFLREQRMLSKYLLSDAEEKILNLMRLTGSNAWNNLYHKVTSNLLCELEIDGEVKKLPLMKVRNMAYEPSKELREKAYYAELSACEQIADTVAQCLNSIKGEFLTEVGLRGYESPLQPMLIENRISYETFSAMMEAVKESTPTLRKYLVLKARMLGHERGLPWYDLFAPMGSYEKRWTFDEARSFIVQHLSTFSSELGSFVDGVFEKKWIDAETRPGKRGGAFCASIKALGESRILMSFDGTLDNVLTLAHELGHAFHNYCLRNETPLNSVTPATLAETASIFNETLLLDRLKKEAVEPTQKVSLLEKELSDVVQTVVDIYSRYLFESEVFERRKHGTIATSDLKEIMIQAQREAYGEGLDERFLHPYAWVVKPHYYYPTFHFYNFPYTFGLLFALGVYTQKDEPGFFEKYKRLLASTGKGTAEEVAASVGLDITRKEFWKSSLHLIEQAVDEFEALSKML
ncbi:M3 family oligoendopeptidase [Fervidobacterium thailandense]|uniref:Peptidase M3 n=1 Tax=Fervidobacterium thailandense TaxID=1008305 RepID=A0A1E3G5I2_9BACT|nr:M3 family oligoendopeptidase [Fervidobacterium thailandense]ODN31410.1 peptidase M3 [Fervidobacterium thailandense]